MNRGVGIEQTYEAKEDELDATAPAVVFGNTNSSHLSQQSPSNVALHSIDEQPIAEGGDGEGIQSALIECLVAKLKVRDITKEELVARLRELQGSPDATSTAAGDVIGSSHTIPSRSPHRPRLTLAPARKAAVAAQRGGAPQQSATESATEADRGTLAVNGAGFFSPHDRQVIIKTIAKERRRRALDVMHSWSEDDADSQAYLSLPASFSRAAVQTGPTKREDLPSQSPPRKRPPKPPLQASSTTGAPDSSFSGGTGQVGTAVYRRTAWGHVSGKTPMISRNEISTNDFISPTRANRTRSGRRFDVVEESGKAFISSPSRVAAISPPPLPPPSLHLPPPGLQISSVKREYNGDIGDFSGNGIPRSSSNPSQGHSIEQGESTNPDSHKNEEVFTTEGYPKSRRAQRRPGSNNLAPRRHGGHHHDRHASRVKNAYRRSGSEYKSNPFSQGTAKSQSQFQTLQATSGGATIEEDGDHENGRRGKTGMQGPERLTTGRTVDNEEYHFRSFSEERARRGEELVRREIMTECTFKPKIKGLPQSYGATNHEDTPFLQRINQWQKEKEKDAEARKVYGQDKEQERCTFAPKINKTSQRAARCRRESLGENNLGVNERLYEESLKRDTNLTCLVKEKIDREEERLRKECTFKPTLISEGNGATVVPSKGGNKSDNCKNQRGPRGRSKYRQAAAAVAAAATATACNSITDNGDAVWGAGRRAHLGVGQEQHRELDDCTFTPMITGAKKGMDHAQQYLQFNVVERLTGEAFRPIEHICDDDSPDQRIKESMTRSIEDTTGSVSPARVSTRQRKRSSDTDSKFHAFLTRQNQLEAVKLKHVLTLQNTLKHSFQPELCPESIKIHRDSNKGDFLQRVIRDAARKEHEAVRQQAEGKHDPECTFKPQITARSANLQGRSVVELSRGDQLKRETTQRLAKLRAEQEVLADATFQPRLNEDPPSCAAVSKLKIVSDPDSYIAKVEAFQMRRKESIVRREMERSVKILDGCTFRPETTTCPTYITRIAQSLSASKSNTPNRQVQARPDWR